VTAKHIIARLHEAGPDDVDPRTEINRYTKTADFDEGAYDILDDARGLYEKLDSLGIIGLLSRFDKSAVAQAVIRLAIERRRALGADNAYKLIKKHAQYSI
jgi:hypothetical protein